MAPSEYTCHYMYVELAFLLTIFSCVPRNLDKQEKSLQQTIYTAVFDKVTGNLYVQSQ